MLRFRTNFMIACEFSNIWTARDILTVSSGLLTPLIAIIATGIAWQQWRTNHLKVQHDLYERKLAVYTALMEFLDPIFSDGNVGVSATIAFLRKTRESYFLFGNDIEDYLKLIHDKAIALDALHSQIHESNLPDGDRSHLIDERTQLKMWFNKQPLVARDKFAKHLKLY